MSLLFFLPLPTSYCYANALSLSFPPPLPPSFRTRNLGRGQKRAVGKLVRGLVKNGTGVSARAPVVGVRRV